MSKPNRLTLREARETGQLERFAKENPAIGAVEDFDFLLTQMAQGMPPKRRASSAHPAPRKPRAKRQT